MDEEDARSLCLFLTTEGKAQATKIISIFDGIEKKFEKLGRSRTEQLSASLQIVSETLEEDA